MRKILLLTALCLATCYSAWARTSPQRADPPAANLPAPRVSGSSTAGSPSTLDTTDKMADFDGSSE